MRTAATSAPGALPACATEQPVPRVPSARVAGSRHRIWRAVAFGILLIIGVTLRLRTVNNRPLRVDEAESSINAFTILEHGYPTDSYLGLPIFENTLIQPWPGHPEYEFRDVSYSSRGLAVYHGWLPLYAIAAAFRAGGVSPDSQGKPTAARTLEENQRRSLIARLPAIVFGALFLILAFAGGWTLFGPEAAFAALTIAAVASTAIEVSVQARYYAPLFFFSTASCLAVWKVRTEGRWRDYLLCASAFVMLFYTHLLGFTIASLMLGFTGVHVAIRRPREIPRLLVLGAILASATLPWLIGTDFLTHRSQIPSGWSLLHLPQDVFRIVEGRLLPLLCAAAYALLAVAARLCKLPGRLAALLRASTPQVLFLGSWAVTAHVVTLLLMPSASVFWNRMAYSFWGVLALLFAGVISVFTRALAPRWGVPAAIAVSAGILAMPGSLSFERLDKDRDPGAWNDVQAVVRRLAPMRNAVNTKLYARPSANLVLTFYTGLPIQSIAPVRREFLDSFPGTIVFVTGVRTELLTPATDTSLSRDDLDIPMLRGIEVNNWDDWWQTFFYRYSGYEHRRRERANYVSRLRGAARITLEGERTTLFVSPPRTPSVITHPQQRTEVPAKPKRFL